MDTINEITHTHPHRTPPFTGAPCDGLFLQISSLNNKTFYWLVVGIETTKRR